MEIVDRVIEINQNITQQVGRGRSFTLLNSVKTAHIGLHSATGSQDKKIIGEGVLKSGSVPFLQILYHKGVKIIIPETFCVLR